MGATESSRPDVSVICCHTGRDKLAYLARSLDEQDVSVERVFIDNSEGRFGSAASALNHGARRSTGDLLLFCHQDVRFRTPASLGELVARASACLRDGDVGGVAGAREHHGKRQVRANITHGPDERRYAPTSRFDGSQVEVQTVDECLVILPRATWEAHPFDESVCDGWHFYGVEQALHAVCGGHHAYVFDADVNHLSSVGTMDAPFYRAAKHIARAYHGRCGTLFTTTGVWRTSHPTWSIASHRMVRWLVRAYHRVLGRSGNLAAD